jgi:hypothetical protein
LPSAQPQVQAASRQTSARHHDRRHPGHADWTRIQGYQHEALFHYGRLGVTAELVPGRIRRREEGDHQPDQHEESYGWINMMHFLLRTTAKRLSGGSAVGQ